MLESIVDFNDSMVKFSEYHHWHELAYIVNGYALLDEMRVKTAQDRQAWKNIRIDYWREYGKWKLPTIEMLILLFLEHRRAKFILNGDRPEIVDSLLLELAELTGNTYTSHLSKVDTYDANDDT